MKNNWNIATMAHDSVEVIESQKEVGYRVIQKLSYEVEGETKKHIF